MKYSAEIRERFKWPVSVSRGMQAQPQQIWSAITKPGNLNDCHPFCEDNSVCEWPGVGSKDVIHYYSGWVMQREFVSWIDGVGYDLLIGKTGDEKKSYVSWRITEEQKDTGKLTITIYPYSLQHVPAIIRWAPYKTVIQPALHSYLESVLKGFEWFITTGKPVSKDQFGSHSWFSNKEV